MAKKVHVQEDMDMEEEDVGTHFPEPKEEPPVEAAGHDGVEDYVLLQNANIAHQDCKAGQVVPLTYDLYQSMRAVNVHAVPVPKMNPV